MDTFAYAAVLFAGVFAVVASIIWYRSIATRHSVSRLAGIEKHLRTLYGKLASIEAATKETANAKLAVELASLDHALTAHVASSRKNFGKIWQRLGREETADVPSSPGLSTGESDLDAFIALQRAHGSD